MLVLGRTFRSVATFNEQEKTLCSRIIHLFLLKCSPNTNSQSTMLRTGGETKDNNLLPPQLTISLERQSTKAVNERGAGYQPTPGLWTLLRNSAQCGCERTYSPDWLNNGTCYYYTLAISSSARLCGSPSQKGKCVQEADSHAELPESMTGRTRALHFQPRLSSHSPCFSSPTLAFTPLCILVTA